MNHACKHCHNYSFPLIEKLLMAFFSSPRAKAKATLTVLLWVLVLGSAAYAQTRELVYSGQNEITITSFSPSDYDPRDLTKSTLPIVFLKQHWDTSGPVRWDIASTLALLSEKVYEDDKETLDYLLRGMGFTKWVAIRNKTMAAHVVSGTGVVVVIFRGTNATELPDWYTNLSVDFEQSEIGRTHTGFTSAYMSLKNEVHRFVNDERPTKMWITGHSLGGAMAVACAVDYTLQRGVPLTLVTFGQPRFADTAGAMWIDQKLVGRYARFVHGSDIVPSVPFYVPWAFPYAHAGNLIAIDDSKVTRADSVLATPMLSKTYCGKCGRESMSANIQVYQTSVEPPPLTAKEYQDSKQRRRTNVMNASGEVMTLELGISSISDHSMTKYLKVIRKHRDKSPFGSLR